MGVLAMHLNKPEPFFKPIEFNVDVSPVASPCAWRRRDHRRAHSQPGDRR